MSISAILKDKVVTNSLPQYLIARWEDTVGVPANSDSTSLIVLEIPGLAIDEASYRQTPNKRFVNGAAYAIELIVFNISCLSTDYDIRILNKNDITKLNTIYEIVAYDEINLSTIDSSFDKYIIKNKDNSLTNKLYLYIKNDDAINATGNIHIELTYLNLQNRPF